MKKWFIAAALLCCYLITTGFTVVGHRGDPLKYPEETFQSDDHAFANGADYVELDVHESKDGVLVVQHDPTITRTTGAHLTIGASTFAQLHQYHSGNGEPVHSLAELFAHYQAAPNTKFLIETKVEHDYPHPDMEAKIAALVKAYHMEKRVMFHSFSKTSLQRLAKVLPTVPRLLIVGSLKKLNFSNFEYVTGIDIGTDLVTQKLVSELHYIGQKVYVWDEMTESASKWRWLANINMDGIVTNYADVAHQFQALEANTKARTIDNLGTNSSLTAAPVYENPYQPILRKTQLAAGETVQVMREVAVNGTTFYQIGQNRFVPTTTVNIAPVAGWAQLFLNQTVTIAGRNQALAVAAYAMPSTASGVSKELPKATKGKVLAVKYDDDHLWLQLKQGWVSARSVTLQPNLTHATNWLNQFKLIPLRLRPALGLGQNKKTGTIALGELNIASR